MPVKPKIERVATDIEERLLEFFANKELCARHDLVRAKKIRSEEDALLVRDAHSVGAELIEIISRKETAIAACREAESSPVQITTSSDLRKDLGRCFKDIEYDFTFLTLYLFKDRLYAVSGPFSANEFSLLVREEFDKERHFFERLSRQHADPESAITPMRERIPESVRIRVWRRDGGKCARCGSRERIEFDHIVPVSEGGGNTERNIELLCEKCNRTKGSRIQ